MSSVELRPLIVSRDTGTAAILANRFLTDFLPNSNAEKLSVQNGLLIDFFSNSNVGFAIFDDHLRYQALNGCLAAIHGIPAESHGGKNLQEILGEVAVQVEPAIKHVLITGQPIFNFEVTGALPTKAERRRWVGNLFPLKDANGRVEQVGAVVVELAADAKLEPAGASEAALLDSTVLRSWKEIADYMGSCVRTVQRWEQTYKLPIRRLTATKGAVVFAFRAEIDSWMRRRTIRGEASHGEHSLLPPPSALVGEDESAHR